MLLWCFCDPFWPILTQILWRSDIDSVPTVFFWANCLSDSCMTMSICARDILGCLTVPLVPQKFEWFCFCCISAGCGCVLSQGAMVQRGLPVSRLVHIKFSKLESVMQKTGRQTKRWNQGLCQCKCIEVCKKFGKIGQDKDTTSQTTMWHVTTRALRRRFRACHFFLGVVLSCRLFQTQ